MYGAITRPALVTATFAALTAGILTGCGNQTITPPTPAPSTTSAPKPTQTPTLTVSSTPTASSTSTALPPGVPVDFPTRGPQPDGFTFESGLKVTFDGKPNFTLRYIAPGDQSDAARNFSDTLQGDGFTLKNEFVASDGKSGLWKLQGRGVNIGLAFAVEDDHTNLILDVTLVEK